MAGSGKTAISKNFSTIKKKFGYTVLISGDEIRNIFDLKYDKASRLKYAINYSKFAKHSLTKTLMLL